jgi:hypothetical protein
MTSQQANVDLTKIGAAVELPPANHPIFSGYKEQAELNANPVLMAHKIALLEIRLSEMERKTWKAKMERLWKRSQIWLDKPITRLFPKLF